jgi:hypothetical protein
MVEETSPARPAEIFWQAVGAATDLAAYRPARNPDVEVARLQGREGAYYVLKEPQDKNYLRLSEQDYAVWWQMNGRHTFKDLLSTTSNGTALFPSITSLTSSGN